jgi:hypothetical protein
MSLNSRTRSLPVTESRAFDDEFLASFVFFKSGASIGSDRYRTDNPESKACKECDVAHVGRPNWRSKGLALHAQLVARIQVQVVQRQPSMHLATIGGLCSEMRKIFHLPSEEDLTNQLSSLLHTQPRTLV